MNVRTLTLGAMLLLLIAHEISDGREVLAAENKLFVETSFQYEGPIQEERGTLQQRMLHVDFALLPTANAGSAAYDRKHDSSSSACLTQAKAFRGRAAENTSRTKNRSRRWSGKSHRTALPRHACKWQHNESTFSGPGTRRQPHVRLQKAVAARQPRPCVVDSTLLLHQSIRVPKWAGKP